jgi:hypothetical protein
MVVVVATDPSTRYVIDACTSTALSGLTSAGMRPVMTPGRTTMRPTALVVSIWGIIAVRSRDGTPTYEQDRHNIEVTRSKNRVRDSSG